MNDAAPAIVKQRRDLKEALLDPGMQEVFGQLVPRHMTPERMLRISIACITRTPKLLEVPQVQVLGALVQCAGLGLEPNSPLHHVALIPFWNERAKRYELQTIIEYRGFLELGRRTGKQKWVHADVVRPGDEFDFAYGNGAHLVHVPGRGAKERPAPTDAYCYVDLHDGFAFTVLPEWEILRHRQFSFAWRKDGERSPWGQHPDRMWRKTAIRVLYSGGEVPLDTELAMAISTDDQRMDYRAMGELAMRGGKAAIEHLKEGMDTFVAESEDGPEDDGPGGGELKSQVRAPQTAPGRPQSAPEPERQQDSGGGASAAHGADMRHNQPSGSDAGVTVLGKTYERLGAARTALLKAIAAARNPFELAADVSTLSQALRAEGRDGFANEIEQRFNERIGARQQSPGPAREARQEPAATPAPEYASVKADDYDPDTLQDDSNLGVASKSPTGHSPGEPADQRSRPAPSDADMIDRGEPNDDLPHFALRNPENYDVVGSFPPDEFIKRVKNLAEHAPTYEYANRLRTYTSSVLTQIHGIGDEWRQQVDEVRATIHKRLGDLHE